MFTSICFVSRQGLWAWTRRSLVLSELKPVLVRIAGLWNWKRTELFQYNHLFFLNASLVYQHPHVFHSSGPCLKSQGALGIMAEDSIHSGHILSRNGLKKLVTFFGLTYLHRIRLVRMAPCGSKLMLSLSPWWRIETKHQRLSGEWMMSAAVLLWTDTMLEEWDWEGSCHLPTLTPWGSIVKHWWEYWMGDV